MRKKLTMLLMSLLCCVGVVKAKTGDVVDISNGYYTVQCNGNNRFANYNGEGRIVPIDMGRFPTSTYLFTKGEDDAYTIQTSDKKFVTYKSTGTGDQLEIIEESSANDNNKWWVVREGESGTITIVPKQDNIGEKTPGWNYAVDFGGANGALGLWDCDDSNSQWLLKPAAFMAEGQAYIKCGGDYITFISEGKNGAYLGKTQDKNGASIFTITPGNDGKYTIQLGEQFVVNNGGVKVVSADEATENNKWWVFAPNVTTEKSTGTEVDIIASQDKIGRTTDAWNFSDHTNGSNSGLGFYGASDGNSICEIEWIPIDITYKYKFNDDVINSEVIKGCYIGHPYPVPTVELPFGVSMDNLPEGTITAENTTVDINLSVNLPFEYADEYESIDKWYYIQMHSSGGRYIQAMADYIEWLDVDMNVAEADSYTWGFVGNPFDGFKLVNKSTGETKAVNSNGEGNPALGDINTATSWTIKPSGTNPEAQYFCFQYPGSENYMNAQNGKIAFWDDADNGSTMWVTERDLSGFTELQALIESANAMVDALGESTGVGSVTGESLAKLETGIEIAQAAADAKENCIAAQIALQAALDALETIQPKAGKFYTIVSACSQNSDARYGQSVYVNDEGGLNFSKEGNESKWFQFVPSDESGKFYLYNVKSEKYLSTAKAHNGGQEEAKSTNTDDAVKVTITNMGKDNIVKIVPEGGAMIHAQTSGSKVVAWNNTAYDEASAWTLVEVKNPGVAIDFATLVEAIASADADATVTMLKDINVSSSVKVAKNLTIDMNGKTLTSAGDGFEVTSGTLTITGNGTVVAGTEGDSWVAVWANGGDAIIENGTYSVVSGTEGSTNDCIYAKGGQITINGGTFSNAGNYVASMGGVVINAHNTIAKSKVIINGGTFNPAEGCVAYELKDVEANRVELNMAAKVGNQYYVSIESAIASAAADATVTMLKDINVSGSVKVANNLTIDMNGKTLTSAGDGFEVTSGTLTITGNGTVVAGTDGGSWVAVWANGGNAIIENGTYSVVSGTEDSTNDCIYAKGGQITINGGTFSNAGNYVPSMGGVVINANNTVANSKVVINDGTFNPAEGCVAYEVKDVELGRVEVKNAVVNESELRIVVAAGKNVKLGADIQISGIIEVNKPITIDGNSFGLTSTTDCEFPIAVSQSAEVNVVNCNLTYIREFAAVDTWYALYVPFAVELTDDFLCKYDVAQFSAMTTGSMTITMVEEGTLLDANTPYFIRVKADADDEAKKLEITVNGAVFNASSTNLGDVATLNGVYTKTVASSITGAYALSNGAFKQAAKDNQDQVLKPFRFYLMFNESQSRIITISVEGEDGATSIDSELMSPVNGVIYDLHGRRVENPTKGLYIVNGKKVMIK